MSSHWRRSGLAVGLASLLLLPSPAVSIGAAATPARSSLTLPASPLSEDEKVVHLLNRIGFGPRPATAGRSGDIERVKQMGLAAYIEQQLQPETIPDNEVEQRLASLQTLKMTPTQLLVAYPPPQLLRGIERRLNAEMGMDPEAEGTIFPELAQRRERQERRRAAGEEEANTRVKDDQDTTPEERRARRLEQMAPGERLQAAMNSPARIVIELSQAKLLRAIYSERQLQEVMTDFWFNHFNVFVGKGADRWLVASYERDAIRPHALGKFRDLLGATAEHPAMLFYLDNWLSADPNANYDERELRRRYFAYLQQQGIRPGDLMLEVLRQRGLDTTEAEQMVERQLRQMENAGRSGGRRGRLGGDQRRPDLLQQQQQQQRRRGLNENYARELLELHTLGVDGGYTQQDVIEVARCFTGWTMLPIQFGQQFLYVDELHDKGTKTVLDLRIPNGGQHDGERVLDLLARHPSTARFISTKLARRFVSDEPPPSLIEKMSRTFRESDGDIRAVLRTMLSAEEFWSPDVVAAKVKTPFEFVVSAARATGAEVSDFPPGAVIALRELGQPLYAAQPPTGYKDTADAWVSTGGLLMRMKIALGLASNRLPGVETEIAPAWLRAASSEDLVGTLGGGIVGRPLSEKTRAALAEELTRAQDEIAAGGRMAEARLTLGWVLASPEFQRK